MNVLIKNAYYARDIEAFFNATNGLDNEKVIEEFTTLLIHEMLSIIGPITQGPGTGIPNKVKDVCALDDAADIDGKTLIERINGLISEGARIFIRGVVAEVISRENNPTEATKLNKLINVCEAKMQALKLALDKDNLP